MSISANEREAINLLANFIGNSNGKNITYKLLRKRQADQVKRNINAFIIFIEFCLLFSQKEKLIVLSYSQVFCTREMKNVVISMNN